MISLAGGTADHDGQRDELGDVDREARPADPDLIILGDSAYGVTAEAVAKRPGWAAIDSGEAGRNQGRSTTSS